MFFPDILLAMLTWFRNLALIFYRMIIVIVETPRLKVGRYSLVMVMGLDRLRVLSFKLIRMARCLLTVIIRLFYHQNLQGEVR